MTAVAGLHAGDLLLQLAFAVYGTGEDLDADAAATGFAEFPAEFGTAMDAGEDLIKRKAGCCIGARATADGEALAGGERGSPSLLPVVRAGALTGIARFRRGFLSDPSSPKETLFEPIRAAGEQRNRLYRLDLQISSPFGPRQTERNQLRTGQSRVNSNVKLGR